MLWIYGFNVENDFWTVAAHSCVRFKPLANDFMKEKHDMDSIFSDLATQMDDAIAEVAALAADTGMPESMSESILVDVNKLAGMIWHIPSFQFSAL